MNAKLKKSAAAGGHHAGCRAATRELGTGISRNIEENLWVVPILPVKNVLELSRHAGPPVASAPLAVSTAFPDASVAAGRSSRSAAPACNSNGSKAERTSDQDAVDPSFAP